MRNCTKWTSEHQKRTRLRENTIVGINGETYNNSHSNQQENYLIIQTVTMLITLSFLEWLCYVSTIEADQYNHLILQGRTCKFTRNIFYSFFKETSLVRIFKLKIQTSTLPFKVSPTGNLSTLICILYICHDPNIYFLQEVSWMQQLHYKLELTDKKRSFYINSNIIVFERENMLWVFPLSPLRSLSGLEKTWQCY